MKLSIETIAILENFSEIHPGIIICPGNTLTVRTEAVYAEATVAEPFTTEARLFNVRNLLRRLTLFDDPEIECKEDHLVIHEANGKGESIYPYAQLGSITQLPMSKKKRPLPLDTVAVGVTAGQWVTLQRAIANGVKKRNNTSPGYLTISSDGRSVCVSATGPDGRPEYSLHLDAETKGFEFKCVFKAGNLHMLPGSYMVSLTPEYAAFRHSGVHNLLYFIGSEPRFSSWGGKQSFLVYGTKTTTQTYQFKVDAYTPYEAECIAREKPEEDMIWSPECRLRNDFKAVAG